MTAAAVMSAAAYLSLRCATAITSFGAVACVVRSASALTGVASKPVAGGYMDMRPRRVSKRKYGSAPHTSLRASAKRSRQKLPSVRSVAATRDEGTESVACCRYPFVYTPKASAAKSEAVVRRRAKLVTRRILAPIRK